ncbi:MAG: 2-hydroxyacyl-CoA dehydratase [Proteobacteria bacterium]|nr:2-hydroxyacyl-CoA dehydratase [Pseudomonadota bacterium]
MNAFEEFKEIYNTRENSYVKAWKDQGKKVMGYVCSYIPEEILYAADILPYRITGKGASDTSQADAYLTRVNCSFARCCLELGFRGDYDFLDGAVWVNGCDHIRRCYDNWKAKTPFPFMHMLPVPHKLFPDGRQWYKEEIVACQKAVEAYFGVTVAPEKLKEACAIYNETRKLLRELYDLRTGKTPPFTGAEVNTILSAGTAIPRTEFNRLLREVLKEAENRPAETNGKVRLMIVGSMMDELGFIENVEEMGAVVVTDALCTGTKSFWDPTDEEGDVFENLVDRYYTHAPCPRMAGEYSRRLDFVMDQVKRAGIEGVILEHIKFCDLHGTDNVLLKKDLEKEGIATIELERQYGPLADAGRIRTRVQAFLERIGD